MYIHKYIIYICGFEITRHATYMQGIYFNEFRTKSLDTVLIFKIYLQVAAVIGYIERELLYYISAMFSFYILY